MTGRRRLPKDKPQSFIDRCALAFLSALMAFISGALLWLLVFFVLGRLGKLPIAVASFQLVWWFSAAMGILGFFNKENLALAMLSKIWQILYYAWRIARGGF